MDDFTKLVSAIFSGIVLVAIVAVIVSKKSHAPQAIQAIGGAVSSIVASAVNPVSDAYGYGTGQQAGIGPSSVLGGIANDFSASSIGGIIPGGSK